MNTHQIQNFSENSDEELIKKIVEELEKEAIIEEILNEFRIEV